MTESVPQLRKEILDLWITSGIQKPTLFTEELKSYILSQFEVSCIFKIKIAFKLRLILNISKYVAEVLQICEEYSH